MTVTALDRANAEEALLPIPKILDFHDKSERYQSSNIDPKEIMADDLMNIRSRSKAVESKGLLDFFQNSFLILATQLLCNLLVQSLNYWLLLLGQSPPQLGACNDSLTINTFINMVC